MFDQEWCLKHKYTVSKRSVSASANEITATPYRTQAVSKPDNHSLPSVQRIDCQSSKKGHPLCCMLTQYNPAMIKNYLRVAFRNLWRHRGFSFLNIIGLTVGMTAFFLIFLLSAGFSASLGITHTSLTLKAPCILPSSQRT